MRVASWNIGGGRTITSHKPETGIVLTERENLAYFSHILNEIQCDIVGLQEVHSNSKSSQADQLASQLKTQVTPSQSYGNSHIEAGQQLSLASLSKLAYGETYFHKVPNPQLKIVRPNGDNWISLDNGFLVSKINYKDTIINFVNGHMVPFHYFKRNFSDPEFAPIRADITNLFKQLLSAPTIIAADFNYADLYSLLPDVFTNGDYIDVFQADTTPDPEKGQQDHLLISRHWNLDTYEVKKTENDHYLCMADVSLKS